MFRILDKVYMGTASPASGGGVTPTGTISITANGSYNVTDYASANVNVASTTGDYTVYVYDYDGELLQAIKGNANDVIDLPATTPTHEGLEFTNWCATAPISNNQITLTDSDVYVAAFYNTVSRYHEFIIELNEISGLNVAINRGNSVVPVDWGDGTTTSDTDYHTYPDYGTYKITISNISVTDRFFKNTFKGIVKEARLASNISKIPTSFLEGQYSVEKVSLPYKPISAYPFYVGYSAFSGCQLKIIALPAAYVCNDFTFGNNYKAELMFFEYGFTGEDFDEGFWSSGKCDVVWYPDTTTCLVTTLNSGEFYKTNRRFKNVERINTMYFEHLKQDELIFDKPVTKKSGARNIYSLSKNLKKFKQNGASDFNLSTTSQTYDWQQLYGMESFEIKSIGPNWPFMYLMNLKYLKMPKLTGNSPILVGLRCPKLEELDLTELSTATSMSNTTTVGPTCVIKITFDQYGTFTTATNWSLLKRQYKVVDPAEITFDVTPSDCTILTNDGYVVNNQITWMLPSITYLVHNEQNGVYVYKTRTGISANDEITITEDTTSGYTTVTVNLGYDNVNATYKIGDYTIIPVSTGNTGEYQFKLKLDETTNISYSIDDDNYMNAAGTITVVPGTDSSETITLTPATTTQYVRPDISANGTWGSGELAVKAYSNNADAWKAVDGTTTTYWNTNTGSYYTYSMYFGTAISMSKIAINTNSSYRPGSIKLEVSSDDITYTEVPVSGPVLNVGDSVYSVITPMANQYNYYRITFLTTSSGAYSVRAREILITAIHKEPL